MKPMAVVRVAENLDALGDRDEALRRLGNIVSANPSDLEALSVLGDLQRTDEKYADAAASYTKALQLSGGEKPGDWRFYYVRGIAYERNKQWPKAEADFKRALELNPDQPQVLNYLGYSWVDQGINLLPALDMIQKAVAASPNDGYIIDSLGWAFTGSAASRKPSSSSSRRCILRSTDPEINDHLGDAYWRAGRKLEARFQWNIAASVDKEGAVKERVAKKLAGGLDAVPRFPDAGADRRGAGGSRPPHGPSQCACRREAFVEAAPAKVNLALHVTGRRADGYHELESLVVFADVADEIVASAGQDGQPDASPARSPPAAGSGEANLVRAPSRRSARAGPIMCPTGLAIELRKNLPVAAGLGGGSADAAAMLRLMAAMGEGTIAAADLYAPCALALGADVPVCLISRPCEVRGVGEIIHPLQQFPGLPHGAGQPAGAGGDRRRLSPPRQPPEPANAGAAAAADPAGATGAVAGRNPQRPRAALGHRADRLAGDRRPDRPVRLIGQGASGGVRSAR